MQVVLHQVAGDTPQRFLDGSNLGNDVGAIAVLLDHFLQAAHLALDAAEAVLIGLLQTGIDSHGFAPPRVRCASTVCNARAIELRSEEHTSELQSPCNLVCRLLLEKK